MKMNDAVALVTGANRGIGKALVGELLARGVRRVYAAARDPGSVEPLVAGAPGRVVALRLDVTAPDEVDAAARLAPDVTVLFNNAGVLGGMSLISTPTAQIERDFAVNFFGSLAVTRAFLPSLERAQGGALVYVLTVASLASMPMFGGYSASKAAAFSMTQALRAELRDKRIDVHAAFPGLVDTDMVRAFPVPNKASAADVARGIVDGVERGDEEICPDPMSSHCFATWKANHKDLEHLLANP